MILIFDLDHFKSDLIQLWPFFIIFLSPFQAPGHARRHLERRGEADLERLLQVMDDSRRRETTVLPDGKI